MTDSSGTGPTITVKYYHSNTGQEFELKATILSAVDISTVPLDRVGGSGGALGSQGQVGVTLGGGSPKARVVVIACGRTN